LISRLPGENCLEQAICQNKRRCFFYKKGSDDKEDSGQKRQLVDEEGNKL
jgi:hypothetical protein